MMAPVLVVATRNRAKARELVVLLDGLGIELRDLAAYPSVAEIDETHDSYLANAAAKAVAAAQSTNLPALGEDSGLEVDALGGRPGVRSARFAGNAASDADNVAHLLARLRETEAPLRTARLRCVLVAVRPDGTGLFAEGICEGTISIAPSGSGGFGYDPVFYYPPLERTFAEIDAGTKNGISHRASACARLRPFLMHFLRQ
jgi:XTP/dITP diphosphohydrolase